MSILQRKEINQMTTSGPMFHQENIIPHGREGYCWVFGSNLAGRHGAGAAKVARVNFQAEYGVCRGPTGRAYAIPTRDKALKELPLANVEASVADFLTYAGRFPEKKFFVAGLGVYSDDQVGPLFASAPSNCSLPAQWKQFVAAARVAIA